MNECEKETEAKQSFDDSVMSIDHRLTTAVRQCRHHVDEISREAVNMEEMLQQLQLASTSTSPQRDCVLAAAQKLDSLRQHINATQELLSNVDVMVHMYDQKQPAKKTSSTTPRTELLQRELGRLNSRLCCTVLALERALSKVICRGTQSGMVTTLSAADYCCASGLQKPTSASEAVITKHQPSTSQAIHDTSTTQKSPGICEQWLASQRQQMSNTVSDVVQRNASDTRPTAENSVPASHLASKEATCFERQEPGADDDNATSTSQQQQQQQQSADSTASKQQVSLQDIHRMIGNIISDIEQPEDNDDERRTSEKPVDVMASNLSVMTDSAVASSTNLLPAEQSSQMTKNNHQLLEDTDEQRGHFDDGEFAQDTQRGDDEDCGLFHCSSFGDFDRTAE